MRKNTNGLNAKNYDAPRAELVIVANEGLLCASIYGIEAGQYEEHEIITL